MYSVYLIDAFTDYPICRVASGKTRNDANAIAAELEEKGRGYRCRIVKE